MEGLGPRVISSTFNTDQNNVTPTEEVLKEELQAQVESDSEQIKTRSENSRSVSDIQRNYDERNDNHSQR